MSVDVDADAAAQLAVALKPRRVRVVRARVTVRAGRERTSTRTRLRRQSCSRAKTHAVRVRCAWRGFVWRPGGFGGRVVSVAKASAADGHGGDEVTRAVQIGTTHSAKPFGSRMHSIIASK